MHKREINFKKDLILKCTYCCNGRFTTQSFSYICTLDMNGAAERTGQRHTRTDVRALTQTHDSNICRFSWHTDRTALQL